MISRLVWALRTAVDPRRGEVWWADLGKPDNPSDHEQAFKHVVVVIQDNAFSPLSTVIVVPTTTALARGGRRGTVRMPAGEGGLSKQAVILCHEIRALNKARFIERTGEVSQDLLAEVETTIAYVLGLA